MTTTVRAVPTPGAVASRLEELRLVAATEPDRAQNEAWEWFRELGSRRHLDDLETLFALGTAPRELDGPTEGAFLAVGPTQVGALTGPVAAASLRLWRGKSFEHASNTGGNLVAPQGRRILGLLRIGADFQTRIGSGIPGSAPEVLLLDYSRGRNNGRLLGRVIDEVVTIVPDTYLLRGMWRSRTGGLVTLCYVALRQPSTR